MNAAIDSWSLVTHTGSVTAPCLVPKEPAHEPFLSEDEKTVYTTEQNTSRDGKLT